MRGVEDFRLVSAPSGDPSLKELVMPVRERRYSHTELARRGDEIYDRDVRPKVESDHRGEFVVIDIETGEFEVAQDELTASDRLLARLPDAQVWLKRVGSLHVRRFGPRRQHAAS